MKYFLAFIRFWKKFIFGSDSNIAIFTMWAVIFVWSFTSNYMNMWWVLPLAVSVMILLFFYSDRVFENSKLEYAIKTVIPSIITGVVPLFIFRMRAHSIHESIYPAIIFILTICLLGIVLYKLWTKYPLSIFVIFMAITAKFIVGL